MVKFLNKRFLEYIDSKLSDYSMLVSSLESHLESTSPSNYKKINSLTLELIEAKKGLEVFSTIGCVLKELHNVDFTEHELKMYPFQ